MNSQFVKLTFVWNPLLTIHVHVVGSWGLLTGSAGGRLLQRAGATIHVHVVGSWGLLTGFYTDPFLVLTYASTLELLVVTRLFVTL